MKTKLTLLLLPLFVLLLSTSCGKDEDNDDSQQTTASNPMPEFGDSDGFFAAVQSQSSQETPIGPVAIDIDAAAAAVIDGGSNQDMGTVSLNTNDLDKVSNNAYVLPGSSVTTVDFDFGVATGVANSWSVAGNGSLAAFNYTTTKVTPSQIALSGDYSSVNTSNNLVVQLTSAPLYADSILYILSANNTSVKRTVAGNVTSVTFTANELSSLNGSGVVQAAAYNFESGVFSGKKLYFINESVATVTTDFQ